MNQKNQKQQPIPGRILPHNEDAEKAVLGAIMLEKTAFPKVAPFLSESSFYFAKHQYIFRAISSLYTAGEPIDMVTVTDRLKNLGLLSDGSAKGQLNVDPYDIATITGTVGSAANIEYHVGILTAFERRREIISRQEKVFQAAIESAGDFEEAVYDLREYIETSSPGYRLSKLIKDPTEEDFAKAMKEAPTGIPVSYEFSGNGSTKQLILPGGALTYICAPTSHGKSTFLRNMALEVAQQPEPGRVLYFTFEESETDLYAQFLNLYLGRDLHQPTKKYNNFKSIKRYFREGAAAMEKWTWEAKQFFPGYLKSFKEKVICMSTPGNQGKLKIINEDLDIKDLVSAIEYYNREMIKSGKSVKAVFLDYVQLLSAKGKNRSRKEELVEVTNELMHLSVKMKIPFVLAAQLNRETRSPLMLFNQNISDASDLEKSANLIICLWDSVQMAQDPTYYGIPGKAKPEDTYRLERMGFYAGGRKKYEDNPDATKTTLYAKITKYRGEEVGLDAVFEWCKNTGKIVPNIGKEQIQKNIEFDSEDLDPF